jgi:adenine-specific DNA-methyltransferase
MNPNEDYKLPLMTPDPTGNVVECLREAAPQLFSEGRIDFDRLKELLGGQVEQGTERYGLSWAGKSEAFRNVQTPSVATLLPMPGDSVAWDSTENLIIEGDNLEVLKLLQKPYHGKVKMIYIDPPYNTGNEFIYPDNYREGLQDYLRYSGQVSEEGIKQSTNTETSGRFHSNWLSMMYPRLFLARNLMKDDGVIFVSIDDNEVHNLRMLMNEVFGEENFVAQLVWKKSYGGGSKVKHIVGLHEYVIVFCRNKDGLGAIELPPNPDALKYYKFKDAKFEIRGPYRTQPLATTSMDHRPNLRFPIKWNGHEIWPEKQWQWSQERVEKALANDELILQNKNDKWVVDYKQYLKDEKGEVRGSKPFSLLEGPYTQRGTDELKSLFGDGKTFEFPKPPNLIRQFLQYVDSEALILDFFAGSGTTAQAVMELNREDNGNRKFILVQLPEPIPLPTSPLKGEEQKAFPTIAHITRERVRRVIQKISRGDAENAEKKAKEPDLPFSGTSATPEIDLGFRAFKLSSSNFKIWDADHAPATSDALAEQLKLYADNVERLRDQQDILYELILKTGLPLSSRIDCLEIAEAPVYSVSDGQLLICLETPITSEVLRGMMERKPLQILCLDTAFCGNDALKTNTVLEAKSHSVVFRTV